MAKAIYLDVNGRKVLSTDVTYNDLVILYHQYIQEYGEVPVFSKCDSKHNMPQGRIINKILSSAGITYNDFLLQFGKVSHVRTKSIDYDIYLKKFKDVSDQIGRALTGNELVNNKYGLPSEGWFVKYCPCKTVKTYDDFVKWCGYESNKLKKDKEFVINALINLEKELGRPITKKDISLEKTGFSSIVLNRMFGGLTGAKKEIGLMPTQPSSNALSFEYYKTQLDTILDNIKKQTTRNYITWCDIESERNNNNHINHKTLIKAFKREGEDIYSYIKRKGFLMNPSNFSFHYTFDDGERVVSSMEYDFSNYLRSIGFKYNRDYFRDVLYNSFTNEKSKMNCDYKIMINGVPLYVEIAGIIYNCNDTDWRNHNYASTQENNYRDKMIKKEQLLRENNCNFLFLFKTEIYDCMYKSILQDKIYEIIQIAA